MLQITVVRKKPCSKLYIFKNSKKMPKVLVKYFFQTSYIHQ